MQTEDAQEYTEAIIQGMSGVTQTAESLVRLRAEGLKLGVHKALGLSADAWCKRIGGYSRLLTEERGEKVRELAAEGLSTREIGAVIGVSNATVSLDLRGDEEEPLTVKNLTVNDVGGEEEEPLTVKNLTVVLPPEPPATPALPSGRFRCIIIDPPWPMEKIEREVRPDQGQFLDYHTWSIQQIRTEVGEYIKDKAERDGCHVYLWTTQRFLPDSFRLLEAWGVKYQCLMTWRKNVGITPYSWMYDTEHVLFGRIGGLPLQQQGLRLSFDASVTRHSEKPSVFYDRVRQASPEPRLDLFARDFKEGFVAWGNEVSV